MSRLAILAILILALTACGAPSPSPGPGAASPTAAPASNASTATTARPVASAAVALPSPSAATAAAGTGSAPETVRAIHVPSVLFAPLYVALARGYFAEQGITLQLDRATAGQDALPLLANGQLDVVVGGFSAATFNAVGRGLELRIVASLGRQPHKGYPSALMVRKDLLSSGTISTIADLKGRKVALSGGLGATGSYWMATKLRPAGMTLKDIDLVNMGFPEMIAAFRSGAIDAAFPSAPATTQIQSDGTADFFGGLTQPGASAVGVTFGGPFLRDRPAVGQRFLAALIKGARAVQGDAYFAPDNLQAFATYTGAPVEVIKGMDPYDFDPDLGLDTATLEDMQRVFRDEGVIQSATPLPPSAYADETALPKALALVPR